MYGRSDIDRLSLHTDKFDASASQYPQYNTCQSRLNTFSTWTGAVSIFDLAEAGMFSIGDGDRTRCFHCDTPLRQWEVHDDPWVEHGRFSPCCDYLIFSKGIYFVKSTQEFYEIQDPSFEELVSRHRIENASKIPMQETIATPTATATQPCRPQPKRGWFRRAEPREIRSRLDTDQCKILVNLGYPRELVGQVIGEQLQTEGDDFQNFGQLVRAVMNAADLLGIRLHTDN